MSPARFRCAMMLFLLNLHFLILIDIFFFIDKHQISVININHVISTG